MSQEHRGGYRDAARVERPVDHETRELEAVQRALDAHFGIRPSERRALARGALPQRLRERDMRRARLWAAPLCVNLVAVAALALASDVAGLLAFCAMTATLPLALHGETFHERAISRVHSYEAAWLDDASPLASLLPLGSCVRHFESEDNALVALEVLRIGPIQFRAPPPTRRSEADLLDAFRAQFH